MLFLATLLITAAMLVTIKMYNGEDDRLPPVATRKGKEARTVMGIVLFFGVIVIGLNTADRIKTYGVTTSWIFATAVAVGLPTIRYIKFKKGQKKK